jgi:hypothetical protein
VPDIAPAGQQQQLGGRSNVNSGDDSCLLLAEPPTGCKANPCKKGMGYGGCKDKKGADKGRTCTCSAGYTYKNDNSGCVGAQSRADVHVHADHAVRGISCHYCKASATVC